MATAIVSDLHLGTVSGADVARRAEPLTRLLDTIRAADRVIFLGDLLELRERPVAAVLGDVTGVLREIGAAAAGKQVVLVPGNHDYQLVAPALERSRLIHRGEPALAHEHVPRPGDLAATVADLMPQAALTVSYPGVWLRDDVFATHGHYLDVHMTVPRVESLVAAVVRRYATRVGRDGPSSVDEYEAILAPLYALGHSVAQNARVHPHVRRNNLSRSVWAAATGRGSGSRWKGLLIGRAAIPGAVAAINAAGFGPFGSDISAEELRRAGLSAMAEVVDRLDPGADYVIFGHTHRAGPLNGDHDGWTTPGGTRLVNSGSWIREDALGGENGPANPYWPGRVVWLGDTGPPRLENALSP